MKFALCVDDFDIPTETVRPFLNLARAAGAEVEVIHVTPVSTSTGEAWSGSAAQVDARVRERVQEAQSEATRKLSTRFEQFSIKVLPGTTSIAQTLVDYCENERFDMIALASHKPREGEGESQVGTVASEVVNATTIPVCLLYPYPKQAEVDHEALAIGSFVFTSDGHELGAVEEVLADRFRVAGDGGSEWWLPRSALAGAVSGRSELHFSRAAIDEYVLPGPSRAGR
jgi:nucleotide-binding universal stress UspA family protein